RSSTATSTPKALLLKCLLDGGAYEAPSNELLTSIRLRLQQQRALGHDDFRAMVEAKTNRFTGVRPAHRPRKPNIVD
ncbi:hypothetical protein, partial [Xanthomonas perforans]|uniref:hypothetical protein n=1 Tax=Xanthomonas perforans TaxID=442694 RepID=UPI001E4BF2BB